MVRSKGFKPVRPTSDMPRERKLDAASVLDALPRCTDKRALQRFYGAFEWKKIADVLEVLVEEGKVEVTAEGWRPSSSD